MQIRIFLFILVFCFPVYAEEGRSSAFSFEEADIRLVINAISKITGKNFLIDPRVRGKVTMVASSALEDDKLYEVFLAILKQHGFAAVPTGFGITKIVPIEEARFDARLRKNRKDEAAGDIVIRVIKVIHAEVEQIIPVLRPLISRNGYVDAHQGSNNIVISDTKANVERAEEIIKKMDVVGKSELKVIRLTHVNADEVVADLEEMLEDKQVFIRVREQNNTLLVRANPRELTRISALIRELDAAEPPKPDEKVISNVAVIKPAYADAKNIVDILNKAISGKQSEFGGAAQLSVDDKSGSVVIYASSEHMEKLKHLVGKLDIKRNQVMVEALIVEMSADKSRQLGIQWGGSGSTYGVASENVSSSIGSLIGIIRGGSKMNFKALAEALASDADANLISAPSVITMENEEAEIEIGREVPFVTGSYTSTGNSNQPNNPFQTINRENVGLKLKITPKIKKDEMIKLNIEQEFSNILPGAKARIGATDVVTSKRSIKTNVLVNNGHILVLGGLIDDNVRESETRVMGFSKIPIIGGLFKHRGTTKEKRNLMIFIRPYIIVNRTASNKLTGTRYNYMRNLQLLRHKRGVALIRNETQPLMDDLYSSRPFSTNAGKQKKCGGRKHQDYDVLNPDADDFEVYQECVERKKTKYIPKANKRVGKRLKKPGKRSRSRSYLRRLTKKRNSRGFDALDWDY